MIITCPHCNARYKVQDGLIKERGKKVKCKKCTSVFIAYPDKPSVLQRPPAAAAAAPSPVAAKPSAPAAAKTPQPTAPPAPPVSREPAPQATVKVDRSMLNNFIQDAANKARKETPVEQDVETDKLQRFIEDNREPESGNVDISGGATVQVDRSQIDAFMQSQDPDEKPDEALRTMQVDQAQIDAHMKQQAGDGAESLQTMQVDQSQINAFMQSQSPGDDALATMQVDRANLDQALQQPPVADNTPHETIQVDRASIDQALQTGGEPEMPSLGDESGFDDDLPGAPDFSDFGGGLSDSPSFDDPGPASQPEVDTSFAPPPNFDDDDFGMNTPDVAADLPSFQSGEDMPSFNDFGAQDPEPPGPVPHDMPQLYKAQVDGRIYPDLDEETVGQWIKEERLLETDLISPMEAADFRQADTYSRFQKFFIEYYGNANREAQAAQAEAKEEKRGFVSRLFGRKK